MRQYNSHKVNSLGLPRVRSLTGYSIMLQVSQTVLNGVVVSHLEGKAFLNRSKRENEITHSVIINLAVVPIHKRLDSKREIFKK